MFDKQLRLDLLNACKSIFKPHGFRLKRSKDCFVKSFTDIGVSHLFYLILLDGENTYRISPQVGVRLEVVERIFHLTSGFEQQYQADTPTIGSDIWRLTGIESYIEIASHDELPETVASMQRLFIRFSLPYFAQQSTIDAIDHTLNDFPHNPCPHRIMDYLRSATGTIVAKLNNRPNYIEIVEIYSQQMKFFANGFYLPRYEALVKSLGAA